MCRLRFSSVLQRYDSGLRVLLLKSLVVAILGVLRTEKHKGRRTEGFETERHKSKNRLQGDDFTGGRVGRGAAAPACAVWGQ